MLTLELSSYVLGIPNDGYQHSVNSDWQFNTQSRVLQADWLMLENTEKVTLNINMPYCCLPPIFEKITNLKTGLILQMY